MRVAVLFHDGSWVRSRVVEAAIKRLASRHPDAIICDQDHPHGAKIRSTAQALNIPYQDVHDLPQRWWSRFLTDAPMDKLLRACDSVVVFWDDSREVRVLTWRALSQGKQLLVVHVGGKDLIRHRGS